MMKFKYNNLSTVFITSTVITLIFISIAFTFVGYHLIESLGSFAVNIDEENNKRISKDLFLELTSRIEHSYAYHFEKMGNTTEVLAHYLHSEVIDNENIKKNPQLEIKLQKYKNRDFYVYSTKQLGQFYFWGNDRELPEVERQINLYKGIIDVFKNVFSHNPSCKSIWYHSIDEYIYGYPVIKEYYEKIQSRKVYQQYYRNMKKNAPEYSFKNSFDYIIEMPYTDLSGSTVLTFKSPVYDDKYNFVGFLGIDVDLEIIKEDLLYEKLFSNSASTQKALLKGFTYILGNNGEIITFPDNFSDLFDIPEKEKVLNNRYVNQYSNLSESTNPGVRNLAKKIEKNELGITEVKLDGKMYTCSYARIKKTKWSIGFVVESNSLLRSAISTKKELAKTKTNMLKSAVIIFIIFLLISLILLFLLFSKFLLKPLLTLRSGFTNLGKGDFNTSIELKSVSEIKDLAISFNYLSHKLKEYMTNLKIETQKKQMIKTEIEIAWKLQNSVLPKISGDFIRKEFDIYAKLIPANDMSGDFYDFFYVRENILGLVIADVSGKGIQAAFYMSMAKAIIKEACITSDDLDTAKICKKINNTLVNSVKKPMFLTMYLMLYDFNTGKITFTNAAHHNFLKVDCKGNISSLGAEDNNIFIGFESNIEFNSHNITMAENDTVVLFTDGITEANNTEGEFFGEENLIKIVKENYLKDINALGDKIINKVIEYQSGNKFDDITCLILKRNI